MSMGYLSILVILIIKCDCCILSILISVIQLNVTMPLELFNVMRSRMLTRSIIFIIICQYIIANMTSTE